jgi:hypothetical protein
MRFEEHILNEDKRTDFLETASMIGIVCSDSDAKKANEILANAKNIKEIDYMKALELLKSYLNKSYDWNPGGKEQIKSLKKHQVEEIVDLFALVSGMNEFMQKIGRRIVGNKPNFIHNQIDTYYKIEKQVLGEIPGAKANTADCIISTVSADATLEALKKGKVEPDSKLEYITLAGGVKIIQVSLKKSEKGAQLGKITNFLKRNLEFGDDVDVAVKTLTEENDTCAIRLLDTGFISEGIWDRIKNMAIDIWNKVTAAIKSAMKSFNSKWLKIFTSKTPPQEYVRDFFVEIGASESESIRMSKELNEGSITAPTQAVIDTISQNPSMAITAVNKQVKKLENSVGTNETIALISETLKPLKKFKSKPSTAVFTLISNYLTVRTLVDMVNNEKSVAETVNRLIAEMLFGGTKLPLWKVYGNYGSGHSYAYLGTIDTFLKDNKSKPKVEILGVKIKPQADFYTISILMLEGVYNDGKKYYNLRTGTNSSSRISFIFEGTGIKGPYPIEKGLKQVLAGEK